MASKSPRHNCYCAFCRTPRRIERRRHVGFLNLLAAAMVSIAFMLAIWQGFDPRVMVMFAFFSAVGEMFVQFRWRLSVACKSCGFDPVLYLKDPAAAAAKVKVRLDERRQDPVSLLSRPLHLPALPVERAEELRVLEERRQASPGALVSRSI